MLGQPGGDAEEHRALSVVIVTRNRSEVLLRCLENLDREAERAGVPVEAVVVDTSTEPEGALLQMTRSAITVRYYYGGDVAYSMVRSRNRGLSLARSGIVAYIDDDCFVQPGWVSEICKPYADPKVVAVGGRIVYHPWHPPRHDGRVAALDPVRNEVWGRWDTVTDPPWVPVPHLPGGNFSVRRAAALAVGGFDTGFVGSAHLEETEFFWRLSRLSGLILYNSDAVVEHRAAPRADGIVRSPYNCAYRYSMIRNRLYFWRKVGTRRGTALAAVNAMREMLAGSARTLIEAVTFAAATVAGVAAGLTVPIPPGPSTTPPAPDGTEVRTGNLGWAVTGKRQPLSGRGHSGVGSLPSRPQGAGAQGADGAHNDGFGA
jgi:GT2 family glycosyltransferase